MHNNPGEETQYNKNATFEAQLTGHYIGPPYILRDTDGDGDPGPIDCIRTRGVNIKQNWLGEVVHLQNIITQTFEIIFRNNSNVKDLKRWVEKIQEFEKVGKWFELLDIYGIRIPDCRITNAEFPTDETGLRNAVSGGQINITVEQRTCGDLASLDNRPREVLPPCYQCTENGIKMGPPYVRGNDSIDPQADAVEQCYIECVIAGTCDPLYPSSDPLVGAVQVDDSDPTCPAATSEDALGVAGPVQDYAGLSGRLALACTYIDDISEDFTFNYGKGNTVDFNHTINIKLFDSCPKGVDPYYALVGGGGPGQAGSEVDVSMEGVPGGYMGDDGDVTDNMSVCRPGQYNVDDALKLAREILDTNTPNFGIAFSPGILRLLSSKEVVPYYTEAQNLITGEVSMSKRLTVFKDRDPDFDWSSDYNHSLVVDQSGIVKVSERGRIRGYKKQAGNAAGEPAPKEVVDDALTHAREGMTDVLGPDFTLARDRCVEFWEAHREFYQNYFDSADPDKPDKDGADKVPVDLKVEHPLEKTRNFNEITRECSYSITFTTSPNIFDEFMANRTLTASRGQLGSITIKEKSELISYTPKGEDHKKIDVGAGNILDEADDPCAGGQPCANKVVDNPIEIIFPADYKGDGINTGARVRAMKFYEDLLADTKDFEAPNPQNCTEALKLWKRNVSWSPSGRSVSYDIEFTTDKTVSCEYPDPHGIRKTEVSTADKLPKRMFKEHAIANHKMLVHDPKQTRLGSRTVDLNVTLERVPKHSMLSTPVLPKVALHELASRAKTEILKVFDEYDELVADDMFVTLCKYTFNSKWQATLTISVQYLQKK
jgi:hypothetical protein